MRLPLRKKLFRGPLRLVRDVDLALGQPLQQFLGWQVDQLDFVGLFEHRVGHRFAYLDIVMRATTSLRLSTCWTFTVL